MANPNRELDTGVQSTLMTTQRSPLFEHWDAVPLPQEEVPFHGAYELIRSSLSHSFENLWKTERLSRHDESGKGEIPALDTMREHGVAFIRYQTKSDEELGQMKMRKVKTSDQKERPKNALTEYCAAEALQKALASSGQLLALEPLANSNYSSDYRAEIRFCFNRVADPASSVQAEWMDHVLGHLHHDREKYAEKYAKLLSHIDANVARYVIDWKPGLFVATDNHAIFHRRIDSSPGADDGTRWHMEWEGLPGIQILYKPHDVEKSLRWKFVSPYIAEHDTED